MSASDEPTGLRRLDLAYDPDLFTGLHDRVLDLHEYEEPYRVLEADLYSPLWAWLQQAPILRIPVPADLRARQRLFRGFDTRVTRSHHSQPPHQDHPHRAGDPRRANLFWAEAARPNASTYFLPLRLATPVAAWWTTALQGDAEAWAASQPKLAAYAEDPLRMSRYRVPAEAVAAYIRLVRDGSHAEWQGLTDFGRITTVARILGNTPVITAKLPAFFAWIERGWPGALVLETWSEPCLILADDTRCLHGRYGAGESGGGFYRMWLAGSDAEEVAMERAYLREAGRD